jgi:hypothetical protein
VTAERTDNTHAQSAQKEQIAKSADKIRKLFSVLRGYFAVSAIDGLPGYRRIKMRSLLETYFNSPDVVISGRRRRFRKKEGIAKSAEERIK